MVYYARSKEERMLLCKKYINDGKKYIYPQKYNDWQKSVERDVLGLWGNECLEYFFKTINAIHKKMSVEQIKYMLNDRYNCDNRNEQVLEYILNFYKRGPKFYIEFYGSSLNEKKLARAKKIEEQNKQFRKDLAKNKEEQK